MGELLVHFLEMITWGDIGFDPLGLKPSDAKEFADIQTKELQNGRLAMLAAIGMIVQEQITHDTIFGTLKFEQENMVHIDTRRRKQKGPGEEPTQEAGRS